MEFTQDELRKYIYNPHLLQKKTLDLISSYNEGNHTISDPTNPFSFLLECTCINASNAINEMNNTIRKKYPSLADTSTDLYHHISDDLLSNIFAVPSEAILQFKISIIDLRNNGIRLDNSNCYQTIIPENTEIEILDTTFTILNDIVIKLYDNGTTYVESQLNTSNDLAYTDIGALNSTIYNTSEATPWILFETKVKQVKRYNLSKTIIASDGFLQSININNKFCFINAKYKQTNTYSNLKISYNDEYIGTNTPTLFVSPYNKNIVVRIPDVYLIEGSVSGLVNIDVYDTMGMLYLPINRFRDEHFNIVLGDTTKNDYTATIENIPILCNSEYIVNGGKDSITKSELQDIIINKSNYKSIPITDKQIEYGTTLSGFKIIKDEDSLTSRSYLALKSLPDFDSELIYAKQDVFFNTVKIQLDEIEEDNTFVAINNNNFIIKSNTIFKNTNGVITITTIDELNTLKNMNSVLLMEYLQTNKYYYTPYYYIINNDSSNTNINIYDLDNPDIINYKILNKNFSIQPSVNLNQWSITKMDYGYRIYFTLAGNNEFEEISKANVILQMKIPLFGGTDYLYVNSTYIDDLGYFEFKLKTDFIPDENNMLTITNGFSNLFTKKCNLLTDIEIFILTDTPDVVDENKFLFSDYYNNVENATVISKEQITIRFGELLNNIYTNCYNTFTERKYKTRDYNKVRTYDKNIYELDKDTASPFICNKNENDHEIEFNMIHRKGEVVLDEEGQPIYEYRRGDNELDANGNPVINYLGGVIRYIDILMLEYEFYIASSYTYQNYKKSVLEVLNKYITKDIPNFNDLLLENTSLKYKSFKTSKSIKVVINGTYETIPYNITPEVLLYISNSSNISQMTLDIYKTDIGNIINKHIDNKVIKLEDIKNEIKEKIGNIVSAVKITNLDPFNSELLTLVNENNKLTLNKVVVQDTNNDFIVKYNIKLSVQYI